MVLPQDGPVPSVHQWSFLFVTGDPTCTGPENSVHRVRRLCPFKFPWPMPILPGSPDWLVGFGDLKKTLVALRDALDVRSHRRWLTRGRSQRHGVFVRAEFAAGGRRRLRRCHVDGQRSSFVHGVQFVTQVGHQLCSKSYVDAGSGCQTTADFVGAMSVPGSEAIGVDHRIRGKSLLPLKFVKMTHGQLQDVSLLQLSHVFTVAC